MQPLTILIRMWLRHNMQTLVLCLSIFALVLNVIPTQKGSTPTGIHCPTASVQTLKQVVTEKDCCGRLITKVVERKPAAGEAEFTQCRCKEAKDSTTNRVTKASSIEIPLVFNEAEVVIAASNSGKRIPEYRAIFEHAIHWRDVPDSPNTRPPTSNI